MFHKEVLVDALGSNPTDLLVREELYEVFPTQPSLAALLLGTVEMVQGACSTTPPGQYRAEFFCAVRMDKIQIHNALRLRKFGGPGAKYLQLVVLLTSLFPNETIEVDFFEVQQKEACLVEHLTQGVLLAVLLRSTNALHCRGCADFEDSLCS